MPVDLDLREQILKTLLRHVVVVVRIAVHRLQKWDAAHQVAARLQDADDFSSASERIFDVLEHRERKHCVE
jgi:hypothetical protein